MQSKNKYALAALALPILVTQPIFAFAADNDQDKPTVLEKIVVRDKKAVAEPLAKSEITEKDIKQKQAQVSDTARLLEDVPGVSLQTGGGVSSLPIIHGLNDERVKVEINGMNIFLLALIT